MKFIKNMTWVFGANLFVSLGKWIILVLIAQFLQAEQVGAYSLAFAITAPITLLANMKLRSLYITEDKPFFPNYTLSRNLLSGLTIIILLLVSILLYPEYFEVIMLVGLSKILDLQSEMYYAVPHKNEKLDFIGKIMVIKQLIVLIVFSLTLYIYINLTFSLLTQLIVQILFLYLIEKRIIKSKFLSTTAERISMSTVKRIILLGLPLGYVQMFVSFNTTFPRYLLEFFESAKTLGYFSAIAYILTIGNMILNSISQIFLPSLARKINEEQFTIFRKTIFLKFTLFSTILGIVTVLLSVLFGKKFLEIVYGIDYATYSNILIIMSIALGVNFISWNFDTALLAMRYISIQPKITTFIVIINVIISYIFIAKYGIEGAAYSLIIVNMIQLLLRMYFVNRKLKQLQVRKGF